MASIFRHLDRKTIAGGIGNTLEWYDFAIYGYFAPIIAKQFFPSDDPTVGLIATFGVFAAGFMMRPIGGIIIGHVADKLSRRAALTLSVALMAIPTTAIAFLPTYSSVGLLAPLLLTFLRLAQGLSVGGEYTGSVTYLVESAPQKRRGLFGSFALVGCNVGILTGSAAGAIVTSIISPEALHEWGWRIPFLFGAFLGIAGVYLRNHEDEAEVVWDDPHGDDEPKFPLAYSVTHHWKDMLHVIGVNVLNGIGYYIAFVYVTTYLVEYDGLTENTALDINTAVMVLLAVLVPTFGALSDRVGRKPIMLAGAGGMVLFSYPLFLLLHSGSFPLILIGQLGFAIVMSCFTGPLPTTMCEQFPSKIRVTAYSVSFNIPLALVGGTAPMVATFLIGFTHNVFSPAFYAMAAAAIAFITLMTMRETKDKPLA